MYSPYGMETQDLIGDMDDEEMKMKEDPVSGGLFGVINEKEANEDDETDEADEANKASVYEFYANYSNMK